MATEILNVVLSKIGEYLLDATVRQVGYLFRFKSNVEGLMKVGEDLRSALRRVQREVDRAKRNTEDIEEDVQKWLNEVNIVIVECQKLEEEIQANKTCLGGQCPNLAWRYRLSRKAETMTSNMLKRFESGKFTVVSHRGILPGIEFLASKDFVSYESTKYTFDKIIEAMRDDKINMVGIYGMGGVGKTTLAKEVGKKVKELNIFNVVLFATVSQTPNFKNIQGQMADLLDLKLTEESEDGRAMRLWTRLRDEKKILVILDDVWAKFDMKIIGDPLGDDHQGCKILLTTRRKQVCSDMGCQTPIPLDALSEEEGLALFKTNAGIGDELPTLTVLAKEVSRECKGLPLGIVTIGRALKGKDIDEWKAVSQKLKNSKFVDEDNVDTEIYACLKLSYDYLKDEKTKECFLLCSLFPEDYKIPLEELLRYGIGLGLFEYDSTIEEAWSELRGRINTLKAACLLLDSGQEKFVKMHDLVRDVALWIASKGKKFMSKAGLGLRKWPEEESLEHCEAISLMENRLEVLPVGLVCPKLKTLLLECSNHLKVSDQFFVEMKALKAVSLILGHMSVKSLQFLTNLQSLSLHGCILEDISAIGMLSKLEILSFRYSRFEELTKELGELGKLRLLDLYGCKTLKRIPTNVIQRLSQLEELYFGYDGFSKWDVEGTSAEKSNASLNELNSLSRLTILSLSMHSIPKDLSFPRLHRYKIRVHIPLYHPPYIIRPRALIMPRTDIIERDSLGTLKIERFESTSLAAFKELFPSLQNLMVENSPKLRYIWEGGAQNLSLHNLTDVEVSGCPSLTCLFTASLSRSLVQLKKLSVKKCRIKHIVAEEQFEDNKILVADGSDIVLPRLRELNLVELESFISFCPENYYSTWPALKNLVIRKCLSLSPSFKIVEGTDKNSQILNVDNLGRLRNGLKSLEVLEIGNSEAEVIFQLDSPDVLSFQSLEVLGLEDLSKLECIWKGPAQFLNMQNLSILRLERCFKLRHIFSTTLARHLLRLKYLNISDCTEMEEIITEDDDKDHHQNLGNLKSGDDVKEIVLRGVEKLRLKNLPNLVHFCPPGCHVIFPSLNLLELKNCPKIATRLSVDQNRSVHAKSEAPQTVNSEAPTMEIFCGSANQIQQMLPPYKDE